LKDIVVSLVPRLEIDILVYKLEILILFAFQILLQIFFPFGNIRVQDIRFQVEHRDTRHDVEIDENVSYFDSTQTKGDSWVTSDSDKHHRIIQ
jgi:hypothetical protein